MASTSTSTSTDTTSAPIDHEHDFFEREPRYSVHDFRSLLPIAPPVEHRVVGPRGIATLLFGTAFCTILALLGAEAVSALRAFSTPAPAAPEDLHR